jgi:hypothetical protein
MQRIEDITASHEHEPWAPDVQRLLRVVGGWAAERPLLLDVVLFGDRLRAGNHHGQPVNIAVRFDDARMMEGFDDWIEELRTNFVGLATALNEPVAVTTPDMGACWRSVVFGVEAPALIWGKVRIVSAPAQQPVRATPKGAAQRQSPWTRWCANCQIFVAEILTRRPAV